MLDKLKESVDKKSEFGYNTDKEPVPSVPVLILSISGTGPEGD